MTAGYTRTDLAALPTFVGNADFTALIDSVALLDESCFQPHDKRSVAWAGATGTAQYWVNTDQARVDNIAKRVKIVCMMAAGAGNIEIVHVKKTGPNAIVVKTDTVTCVAGMNIFLIDSVGVTFDQPTWIGIKGIANILQYSSTLNNVFFFNESGSAFTIHGGYNISYWIGYEPRAYVQHIAQKLPLTGFDLANALTEYDHVQLPSGDVTITSPVVVPANKTITGVRGKTRLIIPVGSTGIDINNVPNVTLRDFTILGSGAEIDITDATDLADDDNIEALNGMGAERGILIRGAFADDVLIDGVVCERIDGIGIDVANTTSPTPKYSHGCACHNAVAKHCYMGLRLATGGEYNTTTNFRAYACQIGVGLYGGNNTILGGNLAYNRVAMIIGAGSNNSHSSIIGATLNHSALWGIYAYDLDYGIVLSACQCWYASIKAKNCKGFQWTNGEINNAALIFHDCPNAQVLETIESGSVTIYRTGVTRLEERGRRDLDTGAVKEPFLRIT